MTHPKLLTILAAVLLSTGCARAPGFMQPAPVRDWRSTLSEARAAADSARWGTADQRLEEYSLRHPGTAEAHEALYWRGLFRRAPGNDSVSRTLAVPTLQRYLSRPGGAYRTEARLLLDRLVGAAGAAVVPHLADAGGAVLDLAEQVAGGAVVVVRARRARQVPELLAAVAVLSAVASGDSTLRNTCLPEIFCGRKRRPAWRARTPAAAASRCR